MASEDRCRLTYAEGNRIREETTRPYSLKGMYCCAAAMVALLASFMLANAVAGLPVLEQNGLEALTDAILGGDADAVDRLGLYLKVNDLGIMASTGLIFGGTAIWAFGDWLGRQALKEANDEKLKILERRE